MNLRDLRYILAVAEERHFGRAAERCHVSQPTLSGQIRKLEDYLGVTLFERTNRSVVTTPVGETITRHARLAVEQAELIEGIARAQRDPMSGNLRLGVIPTIAPYLMPLVLRSLAERYPRLTPVLFEETTGRLLERLAGHEIDAALLATDPGQAELVSLPLFEEPFWVAHPRDHPLAELEEIAEADLAGVDLLLLTDGHCLRDQVLKVCVPSEGGNESRNGGARTNALGDLRAASLDTLLNMVAAGFGCTLIPALAVRGPWMTDMGIIARPLTLATAARPVALWHRRSFPQPEKIAALAEVVMANLPNTVRPSG